MREEIVENLKQPSQWLRIIFMLGFAVVLYVTGMVLLVITLTQALFSLLTTKDNDKLRDLGAALARYVFEILQFLTYNSESKPFPFADFPFGDEVEQINETETATVIDEPVAAPFRKKSATKTAGSTAKPRKKTSSSTAARPARSVKTNDPLPEGET